MLHEHSLTALRDMLRRREISSTEVTQHCLDRIAQHSDLNAFVTVDESGAMTAAAVADRQLARGEADLLTGVPIAHKDIFCTRGVLTTCGSKMLENFVSPYDAAVVERFHQAGSVTVGKSNMDEFAMGSSNETSFFGSVKNPWDPDRVPGGSSGGSAAAAGGPRTPRARACARKCARAGA